MDIIIGDSIEGSFDGFKQFIIDAEKAELPYQFPGCFYDVDFLFLDLDEHEKMFPDMSLEERAHELNNYIEWYRTKVNEFFNCEHAELLFSDPWW